MIKLHRGKTKFIYLPWTIGQTVTANSLVGMTSGQLIPGVVGVAPATLVGVIHKAVTPTSTHQNGVVAYTTQTNVEVEVPVESNVEWLVDVDATEALVLTDIGSFFDISAVSGTTNNAVDAGESTYDVFQCVGFVSATKGIFVLNIGLGADTESDLGA